ncbi:MAG: carbohydrate ABC transporter permease [Armatimonadetes bacterium]|nr:carbohydrate ABC transporter permease [Armatimonadota bacterium]
MRNPGQFYLAVGVALACYAAVWAWLTLVSDSLRYRRWGWLGALTVTGAPGLLAILWPVLGYLLETGWLLARIVNPGGLAERSAAAVTGVWQALAPARQSVVGLGFLWLAAMVATAGAAYLAGPGRAGDWKRRRRLREDAGQIALHLILLTGAAVFSLPFFWMVATSLKPDDMIFKQPLAIPRPLDYRWQNYPEALRFLEIALPVGTMYGLRFVGNTLLVTAPFMALVLASSSLVAFSFARLRWPGRDALFGVLLATMMLPAAVTMIPTFLIFKSLGWVDTLRPLWVTGAFAGAFNVFLLRQFFLTIPTDLEDAAKIDGCGYFTIYARVMLPLIKPALAALAIMIFLGTWNDFMGPLIYISAPERMTGTYALHLFRSQNTTEWALLLAASTMWTLPVVVLFFFTQRYFIQGITLTGMGGR